MERERDGRAGVTRSSRDETMTNQRPVLVCLTNERPGLMQEHDMQQLGRETMGEREHSLIHAAPTVILQYALTNQKTVLPSLTNERPAFIISMQPGPAKHYLQDLSSYVLMSRKPRYRNKLSPCRGSPSNCKMFQRDKNILKLVFTSSISITEICLCSPTLISYRVSHKKLYLVYLVR